MYFDTTKSCNRSCLNERIVGIKNESKHFIATPPSKLKFYNPATCIGIDNSNYTECDTYYLKHVMLGEEINIPACVLDYYDQPASKTQFLINGGTNCNQNYSISGSNQVLLSCDTFQGIMITDDERLLKPLNYL